MELLMNSSQKMQQGRDEQETIELAAEQVSKLLNRPILYALAGKGATFPFRPHQRQRQESFLEV